MNDTLIQQNAIAAAVIGVGSMTEALHHWVDVLGFEIQAQRTGAHLSLEKLWQLPERSIKSQVLLCSSKGDTGKLWLVEFAHPQAPVRADSTVIDLCPKSINLALSDLPARYDELLQSGFEFRSPFVSYPANGLTINEMQWLGTDALNVGMLELVGLRFSFNSSGYAGFTNFVSIVPDLEAETAFFHEVLGLPLYARHRLSGAAIETLVGLPAGTVLNMQVLGEHANALGRVQLIQYEGTHGNNLYPKACPPALGLLHATLVSSALPQLKERFASRQIEPQYYSSVETLWGNSEVLSCKSPAGLRLDIFSQARA
jgi:catechol 2,3-dioxygenase-like lactoylglutathione lyase family enzyme